MWALRLQFLSPMAASFGFVVDAGGRREESARRQIRCFSEDQKDPGAVWKSLSHGNPTSSEVSALTWEGPTNE